MSLTEAEQVFASVREDALNDVLTAFCTDRPRYLVYGSPAFVPATTKLETSMPAIPFPGVPGGGIEWRIRFKIPRVDLFKQTDALPPELTLSPGQFSAKLSAELCVDCARRTTEGGRKDEKPRPEPTCCELQLFTVGHIESRTTSTGEDAIVLVADAVEIVDIAPAGLESVLECLILKILRAVLLKVRLPLRALRVGAFELSLTVGPLIEDDQIKVRGTF